MILLTREANVLEELRKGCSQRTICKNLSMGANAVSSIVYRLSELSAINMVAKGVYEVHLDEYTISDDIQGSRMEKKVLIIPAKYEQYIRKWYGELPRSKLAKKMGIDKTTLNLMIIQLGIGAKHS